MSKRAEEAAMKAYPPTHSEWKRNSKRVQSVLVDTHQPLRTIFQRSYEQAEKDINREMIGRMQKVHEKWTDDMFKDFDYNITIQDPIRDAAQALVDAIERYVQQRCSRSELLNIKNKLKNLLK